ncbi:phosphate signaling complex protein PhoU [Methanofollis fontis]|uniref:Phosphate-specific transport system accessory protein PhoU n=1 Tax=Methanofollis fontis TaxID=2052832 RepID=A0A483CS93_9EURY|nr:phosphate signaling complex protein PhoU [Methanofollis fontis]TAJ44040.1 phosphate transport system regulatory protein PhoU [Methanofollis fontis]
MSDKFHEELKLLRREFTDYSKFAADMLKDAMRALQDADSNLAADVNARKRRLSDLSDHFDERLLTLIALYQPMAHDLRTIVCTLKMNVGFYRIGRYGKDVAILVPDFASGHLGRMLNLPHMAEMVFSMIDDVIAAYESGDVARLDDFSTRDDCVDDMRYSAFREGVTYMMEDPRNINRCMDYVMVARYLERCGDHCCTMAERIHYMVTGERVEIS